MSVNKHQQLRQLPSIDALLSAVAGGVSNPEFDLESDQRGDRESHVESLICEMTGAEAATAVDNKE